jgi:TrmH family RNA methyltransferase
MHVAFPRPRRRLPAAASSPYDSAPRTGYGATGERFASRKENCALTPSDSTDDRFVIVLNEPQDIVNIAGTVRAMMNMGLSRLRIVKPALYDAYRIAGIAHDSEWLLERIEFPAALGDAVADASRIVGTTSRRRTSSFVWQHPREAAPELLRLADGADGPIVILFGREDKGLANEDLDLCDRLLVVPTAADHASLNLAQAVLLVSYELWLARSDAAPLPRPKRMSGPASPTEMLHMFDDAQTALDTIEFFKSRNEPTVMRSLRAILRRADPTAREVRLLRAMAIEVRKYFHRTAASKASAGARASTEGRASPRSESPDEPA